MARRIEGVKGPVRKIIEDWLPPLASVEVFEFDREGNQIPEPNAACVTRPSETRTHADGGRTEVQTISGFDFWSMPALNGACLPTRGAAVAETRFAAEGVPVETVFRTTDGAEMARLRYAHDEKGRISEAARHTIVPPTLPPRMAEWARTATASELGPLAYELDPNVALRVTFKYDDDGRVVEQSQFYDSRLSERVTNTYNEHGDTATVTRSSGDEAPQRSEHEYEYDEWGNWTRQIVRDPFGEISECRREITYYK